MTQSSPSKSQLTQLQQLQKQLESNELQQALESDQQALTDICDKLKLVTQQEEFSEETRALCQDTLCRLITHFPQLTPLIARDLLWQLGGECLHYLADEEIDQFQAIEDLIYEAESAGKILSREEAKAKVLKLH